MIDNQINIKKTTIHYRLDGILHVDYEEKLFDLESTKDIFYKVRANCPWKTSPLLISGSLFTNFDAESKDFLSSDEVMQYYSAVAFISKSLGQKIAANFFIRVNKPKTPSKAFKTKSSALKWLAQFEKYN